MNALRHAPRVYWPFAVLTMFGPLLIIVLQHDPIHVYVWGLLFVAWMLYSVARGSRLAWTLALLWNAFLMFAGALAFGPGMRLGAPGLLLLGLVCAVLQLLPSMRQIPRPPKSTRKRRRVKLVWSRGWGSRKWYFAHVAAYLAAFLLIVAGLPHRHGWVAFGIGVLLITIGTVAFIGGYITAGRLRRAGWTPIKDPFPMSLWTAGKWLPPDEAE